MKKTYKNPTLTVVKIQPAQILAGSEQGALGGPEITGSDGFGAREAEFSDWDETFE